MEQIQNNKINKDKLVVSVRSDLSHKVISRIVVERDEYGDLNVSKEKSKGCYVYDTDRLTDENKEEYEWNGVQIDLLSRIQINSIE